MCQRKDACFLMLIAISWMLIGWGCTQPDEKPVSSADQGLGEVVLETSGDEKAQAYFNEGLLWLHSFEYKDARTAFRKAQQVDPDYAMAYWGDAMTFNHPLWQEQWVDSALLVLGKMGPDPEAWMEKAELPLEKELIKAVSILYGEGDKVARDAAYSKFMGELYEQYPTHNEVAAFYALSLLGKVPSGRDFTVYEQAAKVAEGVMARNARHPGGLHYLIHAYDDPYHAEQALTAAHRYSKVAPAAAHALHMPSHIFVALGMWDEVVKSNEASFQASLDRSKDPEKGGSPSYHALHWLQYAYLQQGRFAEADSLLQMMVAYATDDPSRRARGYLNSMKAGYLIETNDWDNPAANIEVDVTDLGVVAKVTQFLMDGMLAYRAELPARLHFQLTAAEQQRRIAARQMRQDGAPMCSAGGIDPTAPNRADVQQAQVIVWLMEALFADLEGDKEKARSLFEKATALETVANYSYGPPKIVKPSFEFFAEWLMREGEAAAAVEQYEKALERGPKRASALYGYAQALQASGVEAAANQQIEILNEFQEHSVDEEQATFFSVAVDLQ
jgi:tetratricopeptide (TPR) repeat protein